MNTEKALALVNSILDTHIQALNGETHPDRVREALENARQDILLHVEQVLAECRAEASVDDALDDAEEITRGER